jgi:hypothetical protein
MKFGSSVKSNDVSLVFANINLMSVTFVVLNVEIFSVVRPVHPLNIAYIFVTFVVTKFGNEVKFNEVRLEQFWKM